VPSDRFADGREQLERGPGPVALPTSSESVNLSLRRPAGQRPTGTPLELLTAIREAIGMAPPSPDDRLREDEMAIAEFVELQSPRGSGQPRSKGCSASTATASVG